MKVVLRYGREDLQIEAPDGAMVVLPREIAAAPDPDRALDAALRSPVDGPRLRDLVGRGDRVAISVCDGTRPQPRRAMLAAIERELDGIMADEDVTILIATGTHRGNTPEELAEMLGADVLERYRVVNHDCRAGDLIGLGVFGDGVPVSLNREWVEADVRVTTGFVEPHFFAGFSGGPKLIAPGLAALETVLVLHDGRRIGDPRATWGIRHGNPVHDDIRAAAAATGSDFSFDVVLDGDKRIVRGFAGRLEPMHDAACAFAREVAMAPVPERFDVVVTTNSGFPLDQNLYQAVKGMSAAAEICRDGGLIVCAAACEDGIPHASEFHRMLVEAADIASLAASFRDDPHTRPDQWQVQVQARIQERCEVAVYSDGLSAGELRDCHLSKIDDLEGVLADAAAHGRSIAVLPEGPQTIPYVAGE